MTTNNLVVIPSREWLENEMQRFLEKWLKGIFGYEEDRMQGVEQDVQDGALASDIADHIWNNAVLRE